MARKKESGLDVLATLPWPMGIALGALGFWAVRYGLGWYFSHNGGPLTAQLGKQLSNGSLAPLAWLLLAICWLAAGVSYLRRRQRAQLLQTRTDLDSIASLNWRQFEQLVGEAFRRQGYRVEETGQGGADGGIDLVLHRGGKTTLVQCKQWRQRQVNVSTVREMWGLLAHHGADAIKIVCVGDYTADAGRFASGKAIELVTGVDLTRLVAAARTVGTVPTAGQAGPTQDTTEPMNTLLDEAVPACPRCSTQMAMRTNRQNGQQFWGCVQYPRCRGTRPR
ncbi:restriction endonuclease [Lysobacter sp. HA18]